MEVATLVFLTRLLWGSNSLLTLDDSSELMLNKLKFDSDMGREHK